MQKLFPALLYVVFKALIFSLMQYFTSSSDFTFSAAACLAKVSVCYCVISWPQLMLEIYHMKYIGQVYRYQTASEEFVLQRCKGLLWYQLTERHKHLSDSGFVCCTEIPK